MRGLGTTAGKLAAAGAAFGLVLLVSLFLPWAQEVATLESQSQYPSGWEVMAVLDVPIAVLAILAVLLGLFTLMRPLSVEGLGLLVLGAIATVLVLMAPSVEDPVSGRPLDFGGWYFLGLLGALGVAVCGAGVLLTVGDFGGDDGGGDESESDEADDSEGGDSDGGGGGE